MKIYYEGKRKYLKAYEDKVIYFKFMRDRVGNS